MNKLYLETYKKNYTTLGFSLVELLIVIAIIGVLLVIAINIFGGVLQNSKEKADIQQGRNIEKAIRLLINDTNTSDIITHKDKLYTESQSFTELDISNSFEGSKNLIIALQDPIYMRSPETGVIKEFGPYLSNPRGNNTATYDAFEPQWSKLKGTGSHTGYLIEIEIKSFNLRVMPVKGPQDTAPTTYDINQSPGILIVN